jgi:hypothetical protein
MKLLTKIFSPSCCYKFSPQSSFQKHRHNLFILWGVRGQVLPAFPELNLLLSHAPPPPPPTRAAAMNRPGHARGLLWKCEPPRLMPAVRPARRALRAVLLLGWGVMVLAYKCVLISGTGLELMAGRNTGYRL